MGESRPAARCTRTSSTFQRGRLSDSSRPWTANCCAMSPESRTRPDEDHVQAVMKRFGREFSGAVLIGGGARYLRGPAADSHANDTNFEPAATSQTGAKIRNTTHPPTNAAKDAH